MSILNLVDRLPDPPEREVQKICLEYARRVNLPLWRSNSGQMDVADDEGNIVRSIRFNGVEGCSDALGIITQRFCRPGLTAGRFLAVEFKKRGKKATAKQARFLAMVNASGGLGIVADSLDSMIGQLRGAGYDMP